MATPEHVEVFKRGTRAIAEWRTQHPGEVLDLSGADLTGVDARDADLNSCDFRRANLRLAVLVRCSLARAELEGADFGQAVLIDADLTSANLTAADLRAAYVNSARLSRAVMRNTQLAAAELAQTDLTEADLTGAKISLANLINANLTKAALSNAELIGTDLSWANLDNAILSGANLTGARIAYARLGECNIADAMCHNTVFAGVTLDKVIGLGRVRHGAPSSIGVDILTNSFRAAGNKLTPELDLFFRSAGVPQELLAALPGILAEVRYCSCFVSYGEPDKAFALKLCEDLKAKGVSCWIYEMDSTPGERTQKEIGLKRRNAEKMVVLCSGQALIRDGVLKEIEEQKDEDPEKMVPVSLDDLWKQPGFKVMRGFVDLKPCLIERNYADFRGAMPYEQALERLLKGLERKQP